MKQRIFASLVLAMLILLASCEQETILIIDQTDLSFSDTGSTQTITLISNKPWTAGSSQSWCKVSPTGGEAASGNRITISCDANTTYDARNCIVTITCAELMKTISISQATNNGLLVAQTSYELTKEAQQLDIQVQANVRFSVEVDNGCKDWVKYNTTKGLTKSTVVLDIAENATYDDREGKVIIKQEGGNLSSTIIIKQSQLDGLFVTTPEYNLSNDKHTLTVEVNANVEFDVKPNVDWIRHVETKGLKSSQIVLEVSANEDFDKREGTVTVKQINGENEGTITIHQEENYGLFISPNEFSLNNSEQLIDVDSFAEQYIIDELFANPDCGWSSCYYYKDKNGKLFKGPVWDFDLSAGNYNYGLGNEDECNPDSNLWANKKNSWYKRLFTRVEFTNIVKEKLQNYNEIISGVTELANTNKDSSLYKLYKNALERNFDKWDIMGQYVWPEPSSVYSIDTLEGHFDYLYNWLGVRYTYICEQYSI